MLKDLLDLLAQEGLHTTAGLAQRLQVSPALVEQMLADLVRAGYLQEVGGSCQTACRGCGVHSGCTQHRGWVRTAKVR